jgi:hypothetical protein
MKIRSRAGLVAGVVAATVCAAPAQAAAPASVTIRAEGLTTTMVPKTALTTTTAPVNKDGTHTCTGTSAAGALERASAGDWSGTWFDGIGYGVDRIRAESGRAPSAGNPNGTYWALWVNYEYSQVGACGAELVPGDDVLFAIDCYAGCSARGPLRLSRVPRIARPGTTATVLVEAFNQAGPQGPAAGATVRAGGRDFTTGADGIAHVTFSGSGPVSIRATKADSVPSATEETCVTTGSDGACGSVVPSPPDTTAPLAAIDGIRNGQRFSRRRAPRELHGTVSADPSGLWAVKIRLTRRVGKRCWYFSGTRERFLKRTCGKRYAFKVSDQPTWSYLLPTRLPKGRYVLDSYAIDNAFNHGPTDTVRFRVR